MSNRSNKVKSRSEWPETANDVQNVIARVESNYKIEIK